MSCSACSLSSAKVLTPQEYRIKWFGDHQGLVIRSPVMAFAGMGLDRLWPSISAVRRGRDELGYTSDDELKGWLTDAGIEFDEAQFNLAVGQLERLGRARLPRLSVVQP